MDTWISSIDLSNIVSLNILDVFQPKRHYNMFCLKNKCLDFIDNNLINAHYPEKK